MISRSASTTSFQVSRSAGQLVTRIVQSHQALETLRLPQPVWGGKSVLSGMHLKSALILGVVCSRDF